jgi:hypothetical protein
MASILPPEREVRQAALIESGRPQKRYEISRLAQEIFFAGSASAFAMSLGPTRGGRFRDRLFQPTAEMGLPPRSTALGRPPGG